MILRAFYLIILALLLLLGACNQAQNSEETTYQEMDVAIFNEKIYGRMDIASAEDLIALYYNFPKEEGDQDISISSKTYNDGLWEVFLIHYNLKDDSLEAIKIEMKAQEVAGNWEVLEVKKTWKCRAGRGHTNWAAKNCL